MITRSSLPSDCDFTKDFIGLCLSNQRCDNPGDKLKLYIPTLMSLIPKSAPKVETESIGSGINMINASSCRPKVKTHIQSVNYIEVPLASNSSKNDNWEIYNVSQSGKYRRSYVKSDTKFEVEFSHGLLKESYFTT